MKSLLTIRRRRSPRGMTLTELLVVIMIMVLLLGTALPLMRTAVEDRALREGARQLNTYVQLAKGQAAELGRPVGLWIDTEELPEKYTSPVDSSQVSIRFAQRLFLAETPPPYAGDAAGALVKIFQNTNIGPLAYYADSDDNKSLLAANFVSTNDLIKFSYKGISYTVTSVEQIPPAMPGQNPIVRIHFTRLTGDPEPPMRSSSSEGRVPYQVFRKPQKASGAPLEIIRGAVIDLNNSGIGLTGRELAAATGPFVIMFQPGGAVDQVAGGSISFRPTSTIHLMIGSMDGMMEPGTNSSSYGRDYNRNLEDPANLWVSIGHQHGAVVTAENAWQDRGDFATSMGAAREFAQRSLVKGGR